MTLPTTRDLRDPETREAFERHQRVDALLEWSRREYMRQLFDSLWAARCQERPECLLENGHRGEHYEDEYT